MIKYTEAEVLFREIPNEITLCINISNCPCKCPGCHSQHLWEDIGEPLNLTALQKLIYPTKTLISCIALMGGDASPEDINFIALEIKQNFPNLKVAWYSGRSKLSDKIDPNRFDYIKLGPYVEGLGGLDNPNTNQRLYQVYNGKLVDITHKFWKSTVIKK